MFEKDIFFVVPTKFKEIMREAHHPKSDSYFVCVFNFMYYILLCPFKVDKSCNSKKSSSLQFKHFEDRYILKTNPYQRVFCGVIHCSALFHTFPFMFLCLKQIFGSQIDVSGLFDATGNLACQVAVVILIKKFWFEKKLILDFLNASKIGPVLDGWTNRSNNILVIEIPVIYILMLVLPAACRTVFF